jgi:hypothetical protein
MNEGRDDDLEEDGRMFRPYLLTGGRTRSIGVDIPVEALVVTRATADREARPARGFSPEQAHILEACRVPIAIAEIAVSLAVPLGVARVLVSDLAANGWVELCDTATKVETDLIRRLIAGVRAI